MKVIAFGSPPHNVNCERHLVVKHIKSIWIQPSSYDSHTDKPYKWMVNVDLGNFSHNQGYDDYGKAIAKYNEILDAIDELKD